MLSTNPETVEAANPAAPPQPNFRGRWMVRIALLILHIVVVFGAASLTPAGYDFELGKYTGGVVAQRFSDANGGTALHHQLADPGGSRRCIACRLYTGQTLRRHHTHPGISRRARSHAASV